MEISRKKSGVLAVMALAATLVAGCCCGGAVPEDPSDPDDFSAEFASDCRWIMDNYAHTYNQNGAVGVSRNPTPGTLQSCECSFDLEASSEDPNMTCVILQLGEHFRERTIKVSLSCDEEACSPTTTVLTDEYTQNGMEVTERKQVSDWENPAPASEIKTLIDDLDEFQGKMPQTAPSLN